MQMINILILTVQMLKGMGVMTRAGAGSRWFSAAAWPAYSTCTWLCSLIILASDGILNCLNEVDMFCLPRVFLPRINGAVDSFVESWNNHLLSTSNNQTPHQLCIEGALRRNMAPTAHTPTHAPCSINIPTAHDAVEVPRCTFAPTGSLHQELGRLDMLRVTDIC